MAIEHLNISGLSEANVQGSREKYGNNRLQSKKGSPILQMVGSLIKEPMVVLLLATASIYFATGNTGDGIFLAIAIIFVAAISLFQDSRSRNAIESLKKIVQPHCRVIRDGKVVEIASEDVVVGDACIMEEGGTIVADGIIVHSNDFSVDESVLTGESFAVHKDEHPGNNEVYKGTQVSGGLAVALVTAVGSATKLGNIGKSMETLASEKSPLEIQINTFVKKMVVLGVLVFIMVWGINYSNTHNVLDSLLKALTLAMSILPEEIPVAFTTFMAMGAWRLMKEGVIVKQMKTVESLGSATVVCVDKTGTLTQNEMRLDKLYTIKSGRVRSISEELNTDELELITTAMWASEPIPFDPMEHSLHSVYAEKISKDNREDYSMVHEYPLGGKPPMMTHIFANAEGEHIIAAKGAPEALLAVSTLNEETKKDIMHQVAQFALQGYRVLGVGESFFAGDPWPTQQQDFTFRFKGLVAFYDPPKQHIRDVFEAFYASGIDVKIITGDIAETTIAIAKQTGFKGVEKHISGDQLMQIKEDDLSKVVSETMLFTRMFPEAKLKIINTLKSKGEIVAMTGDGVNDGPALKAAHIGIAMGRKGTEIAKEAASLVLLEDDLSNMVTAVAMGRKIYTNLKKAIQYIISIHIPIILTVLLPLAFGWLYPNIFSPVHVILLELIMGPTCSIVYENEPMEEATMHRDPRPFSTTFFNWRELITSVIQGIIITLGILLVYLLAVRSGHSEAITRTMVFTTLIAANIFLTFVNRSFYYSILTTFGYKNRLVPWIIGLTVTITLLLLFVPSFATFFEFDQLTANQMLLCLVIGMVSVIWYEGIKWWKRWRQEGGKKSERSLASP
ncbi:cation-translocating P-type ATPase [uncultured Altibacter sp.]|uniref:cation-translocating P-type ATPase n=1 Tax=uncultured Altibacter sp. TaxID=2506933 RepID=UPI0030D99A68